MSESIKLTVEDTDDGTISISNSTVILSKTTMAQMQLIPFDHVLVKGYHRKELLYFVDGNDTCPDTSIRISSAIRCNLRVLIGNTISLRKFAGAKYADLVVLQPVVGETKNITANPMEDFFKQFFNRTYRPITKGEVFTIPQGSSSDNQGVSFKVVAVEPSSPAIIGDGTGFCYEEEPVKRMDSGESDKIWYDNIGGLRSQIDSINGFINMKLKISESFEDKRSPTCKVPRGIVLYGPNGSGKSLVERAIENELGFKSFAVDCATVVKDSIRHAFGVVESVPHVPAILHFYGLHLLDACNAAILMKFMDGLPEDSLIIVIAETNNFAAVNRGFIRADRFHKFVHFDIPTAATRLEILHIVTKDIKFAVDVDLTQIASDDITGGLVGSDLELIVSQAAYAELQQQMDSTPNAPVDINNVVVGMRTLKEAIDELRKVREPPRQEKRSAATMTLDQETSPAT